MTITQQELLNHVRKHSGLKYSELHEDVGEQRGLNILDLHEEVSILVKKGLLIEQHTIPDGYVLVAA